jgi:hypothetical protein
VQIQTLNFLVSFGNFTLVKHFSEVKLEDTSNKPLTNHKMSLNMKIVKISAQEVSLHPEDYNSNFHKAHEAPALLVPTEGPQSISRWLPLIAKSQNINPPRIQTIVLTPIQGKLLFDASSRSIHTKTLNRQYKEELEEEIEPVFSRLVFPPEGLFMRLNACSPKDGKDGTRPLRSIADIVLRSTSSFRARNAIDAALHPEPHHVTGEVPVVEGINVYFLPFNDKMSAKHEYRVFCAPPIGEITAASQYKWHTPLVFQDCHSMVEIDNILGEIWNGIKLVHAEIWSELGNRAMDLLLLEQGFSFDVMWKVDEQRCALIELNNFGARSGCGACLFHWIKDMDVLYSRRAASYGKEKEIEFRISVAL